MASNANPVDEIELQARSGSGDNPEAQSAGENSSAIPSENAEIAVPPQSGTSGAAEGVEDAGASAAQPLLLPEQNDNSPAAQNEQSCWSWCKKTAHSAGEDSSAVPPENAVIAVPVQPDLSRAAEGVDDAGAAQREQSCWIWCKETIQNGVNFIFIPQEEKLTELPSTFSMFLIFLGIIFYVWDISSDITLAVDYYQRGRENYFWLTLIFIIVPTVFVIIDNIIMFLGEDRNSISEGRWIFRIFFVFVGPLIRDVEAFVFGIKCRNALTINKIKAHKKTFYKLGGQAGALKLFETFLEAAPQATLNIYILMMDAKEEKPASVLQIVSLCASIKSLGWSIASFNRRSMVYEVKDKEPQQPIINIAYVGSIIHALANVCHFLSRAMAFALFASVCPTFTVVIVCVLNWIVMTVFACILKNFIQNFTFDEQGFEKLFLNVGIGWIFCFVFHNISGGKDPRKVKLVYYTVSFMVNSILLFSWFYFSQNLEESTKWDLKSSWLFIASNYLLFFVGLFLLVIYHFKYHPTGGVVPIPRNVNVEQVTPPVQLASNLDSHHRLNINGIFDLPMSQVHSIKSKVQIIHKMIVLFMEEFDEFKIYHSVHDLRKIGVQIGVDLQELMQILHKLDPCASRQTKEGMQSQAVHVNVPENEPNLNVGGVPAAPNEDRNGRQTDANFNLTVMQIEDLRSQMAVITRAIDIALQIRNLGTMNQGNLVFSGTGAGVLTQIRELHEMITQFQEESASSQASGDDFRRNALHGREQDRADRGVHESVNSESRASSTSQTDQIPGPSRLTPTEIFSGSFVATNLGN